MTATLDLEQKKVLITGGSGMVGSALKLYIPDATFLSSKDCDLRDLEKCRETFEFHKPEYVIHLAAKVGGVKANSDFVGDFYRENILINTNVLESARICNVKKLVSLLSTCVYPAKANYPLTERQLHSGFPHETNFGYAMAKRMLDVQSRAYRKQYGCNFICAIPNNLMGENDQFDLNDSHVIPAIIRKTFEAKKNREQLVLWGNGNSLREFTYSGDIARALLFLLAVYNSEEPINIGNTDSWSIREIATLVSIYMSYNSEVIWDEKKPSGQFQKQSSNAKFLRLGWDTEWYSDFETTLEKVCVWFRENYPNIRGV